MKNTIKIRGRVRLVCKDKNGNLKWDTGWLKNTITNVGFAVIAGLVGAVDAQNAFTYLAVGTDSTAESAAHTALQSEVTDSGFARASATVTRETTTQTDDTLQLLKIFTASGAKVIEEAGAFNASSSGIMLGRKLTGTKNMNSSDTLQITYQFIFA